MSGFCVIKGDGFIFFTKLQFLTINFNLSYSYSQFSFGFESGLQKACVGAGFLHNTITIPYWVDKPEDKATVGGNRYLLICLRFAEGE